MTKKKKNEWTETNLVFSFQTFNEAADFYRQKNLDQYPPGGSRCRPATVANCRPPSIKGQVARGLEVGAHVIILMSLKSRKGGALRGKKDSPPRSREMLSLHEKS